MAHSRRKPSATRRGMPRKNRWLNKGGSMPKIKTTARG
jgi:hypothetical protein